MLSVHDPRARGSSRSRERSRSRGGSPPRSRSRDIRAPSPARVASPPRKSKSSRSKKYYDPESEDSEALTESESEDDRRSSRRSKRDKYDSKGRRRDSPSEEEDSEEDERGHRAIKSERDREYETRYQRPDGYQYARPQDFARHMSYTKPPQPDDLAYGEYDDHASHTRHMSINTGGGFHMDVGRDRPPQVYQQEGVPYDPNLPPYVMNVAGSRPQYVQPEQYRYAQPSQHLKYLPKGGQGTQYVATPQAQIEVAHHRKPRREEEEEPRHKSRRHEDERKEKKKSRRDDSDNDKRKKKYRDDSDDDKRKKKYRDDSDDEKRKKKYRDESDDDRRKKKYRDASDDEKRKKKYKDDSDDDKRKKKYRDDSDDDKKKHKSKRHSDSDEDDRKKPSRRDSDKHQSSRPHRDSEARMVEIHPGGAALAAPNLNTRMHRLSVSGQAPGALTLMAPAGHNPHHAAGALPPGSPLLEAYHGTYQSISPMPSPTALPGSFDDGMSDMEPLGQDSDSDDGLAHAHGPKSILKKRVEIYDPEPDALAIAAELKHAKPGAEPLVKILPLLSDDNIMALRTEYKKHFKVNGKGINIAKHIKLKVTGNVGKAAYATALGRWESEAYWSNFWYQSNTSRRELLIESLIGRSNLEIHEIKEAFSDKRYNDSLEKCMQAELKKDKFRHAVLLALEEKRQDELEKLSMPRIERDAADLYKALVSKDGGETAMIDIIVVRSDSHLRQVLQEFERRFKANFAREMIKKSQNLVGETLAHILNGVLNRPVRDALLLHQAINETAKDRAELLVSRLVRMHWEPKHLERVKLEYKRKYGKILERHVAEATKGEFGDFCVNLCGGAVR